MYSMTVNNMKNGKDKIKNGAGGGTPDHKSEKACTSNMEEFVNSLKTLSIKAKRSYADSGLDSKSDEEYNDTVDDFNVDDITFD
eukprot:UN32063